MTRKTGEEVIIVGMKSGEAYNGRKALCDERAADRKVSVMRQKLLAMNMQLNARFSSDNLKDALVKTSGTVGNRRAPRIQTRYRRRRGKKEEEREGDDGRGERSHRFELREKRERESER